jgi:hypothetical protein
MVSHAAVNEGNSRTNTSCRTARTSELFTATNIARLLFAITDPSIRFFTCSKSFPVSCALSQQSSAVFLQAPMFELSRMAPSTVAPTLHLFRFFRSMQPLRRRQLLRQPGRLLNLCRRASSSPCLWRSAMKYIRISWSTIGATSRDTR